MENGDPSVLSNAIESANYFARLHKRRESVSDGSVRCIAFCAALFFLLVGVVDIFWIGGTPTEDCEQLLVRPFLVEGYLSLIIGAVFVITACFPVCAILALLLFVCFVLLMVGGAFWKLIACFGYPGWTCRTHIYQTLDHGSPAWLLSFVFGLIQLIVACSSASCFCQL